MITLTQKTKWFYLPIKLEFGRNLVSVVEGLENEKDTVIGIFTKKFLQMISKEVSELASDVKIIVETIERKLIMR